METQIKKPRYDNYYACPKCGGLNDIRVADSIDQHVVMEVGTKCFACDHEDYWAHGWFQSEYSKETN